MADVAIPFTVFLLMWGFFSHNVLEERFILLSTALMAAMVASGRAAVASTERKPAAIPIARPSIEPA
jgi:hypothetical protein